VGLLTLLVNLELPVTRIPEHAFDHVLQL